MTDAGEVRIVEATDPMLPTLSLGTHSDGIFYGDWEAGRYGAHLAAGRIDSDALVDLVVSASRADAPAGRVAGGAVFVYAADRVFPFEESGTASPDMVIWGGRGGRRRLCFGGI